MVEGSNGGGGHPWQSENGTDSGHDSDHQHVEMVAAAFHESISLGVNEAGGDVLIEVDEDCDEYAGHDVAGKVLVMIRREPQQNMEGGAFQGPTTSGHAYIDRKLKLAVQHNAAGAIFVNDSVTTERAKHDELSPPHGFGSAAAGIPFIHVKQSVVDKMLYASPLIVQGTDDDDDASDTELNSLKAVCDYIDKTMTPASQPLPGWSADLTTKFDTKSVAAHNLIGVLEGEGDLARHAIITVDDDGPGIPPDRIAAMLRPFSRGHIGGGGVGLGLAIAQEIAELHNGELFVENTRTGLKATLRLMRGPVLPE